VNKKKKPFILLYIWVEARSLLEERSRKRRRSSDRSSAESLGSEEYTRVPFLWMVYIYLQREPHFQ
jgi:hypothetical protein